MGASVNSNRLESILDQEEVSVKAVLDHPDVVEECRLHNTRLVKFFSRPETIRELTEFIVSGPDSSAPLEEQYRLCHVSTEILTAGIPSIISTLLRDTEALDILFTALNDCTLTALSIGLISRVYNAVREQSITESISFINFEWDLTDCILNNFDKPSVIELAHTLLIIPGSGILFQRLSDSNVPGRLIKMFTLDQPDHVHQSVVHCLSSLLVTCKDTNVDPIDSDALMEKLTCRDLAQSVIDAIFSNPDGTVASDSLLVCGLQYFSLMLKPSPKSDIISTVRPLPHNCEQHLWPERTRLILTDLLLPHLEALLTRLRTPTGLPLAEDNASEGRRALTMARLSIARFLCYLLQFCSDRLQTALLKLNFFPLLFDLFFEYPRNSLLHKTCEYLICVIVLRAVQNFSPPSLERRNRKKSFFSPSLELPSSSLSSRNGNSSIAKMNGNDLFDVPDQLHRMFFSPPSSTKDDKADLKAISLVDASSKTESGSLHDHPKLVRMGSVSPTTESTVNFFWICLHQLLVDSNLLGRIRDAWIAEDSTSFGYHGHLRHISNLLTTALGPKSWPDHIPIPFNRPPSRIVNYTRLLEVAKNGTQEEFESNQDLRKYFNSELTPDVQNLWSDFVYNHIVPANEICYIDRSEFPGVNNMVADIANGKLNDLLMLEPLQSAYADYCSFSLVSPYRYSLGLPETRFIEPQPHSASLLDSTLSSVNFSLQLAEDPENSIVFEQACNDAIQLQDEDVGKEGRCLPDSWSSLAMDKLSTLDESHESTEPASSNLNSTITVPSRGKVLAVFKELSEHPVCSTFGDVSKMIPYIDDKTREDDLPSDNIEPFTSFEKTVSTNEPFHDILRQTERCSLPGGCDFSSKVESASNNETAINCRPITPGSHIQQAFCSLPKSFNSMWSSSPAGGQALFVSSDNLKLTGNPSDDDNNEDELFKSSALNGLSPFHTGPYWSLNGPSDSFMNVSPENVEKGSTGGEDAACTDGDDGDAIPAVNFNSHSTVDYDEFDDLISFGHGTGRMHRSNGINFKTAKSNWFPRLDISKQLITPTKRSSNSTIKKTTMFTVGLSELELAGPSVSDTNSGLASNAHLSNGLHDSDNHLPLSSKHDTLLDKESYSQPSPRLCEMLASVKVRSATKTHKLPPFVISDADFSNGDSPTKSVDALNGFNCSESNPVLEMSLDMNLLNQTRFRSHRTIQLRSGPEDSFDGPT